MDAISWLWMARDARMDPKRKTMNDTEDTPTLRTTSAAYPRMYLHLVRRDCITLSIQLTGQLEYLWTVHVLYPRIAGPNSRGTKSAARR